MARNMIVGGVGEEGEEGEDAEGSECIERQLSLSIQPQQLYYRTQVLEVVVVSS